MSGKGRFSERSPNSILNMQISENPGSATHSQKASDLEINSLEDQNNTTKELLSHVLKDVLNNWDRENRRDTKEAIRQLKRTI